MRLLSHSPRLAVVKLPPDSEVPAWAQAGAFTSATRTNDELSIVCDRRAVPVELRPRHEWIRFEVEGPLPFSLVGVLAALATPLAEAGVSVYPIATHDTDHVLVRSNDHQRAIEALTDAGHEVVPAPPHT